MKLGIVGLPNVGKSTLFNSLTKAKAEATNYPFSTKDKNVGVACVPDPRLAVLGELYSSKKIIPAAIEFVDIAGLVKGAGKGEGLGNRFLAHIREVDAILHVVRCFEDENIPHVGDTLDPARDIETIDYELIFADIEMLERREVKTLKQAKADKSLTKELELITKLKEHLEAGRRVASLDMDAGELNIAAELNLLTLKPVIFAANVNEDDLHNDGADNPCAAAVRTVAQAESAKAFVVCARLESEISELEEDERQLFLSELGAGKDGLDRLIEAAYDTLGLISFLTAGPKEVRAWTITKGAKAQKAAGKIHSDLERGFIRAEIVNYDDLTRLGGMAAVKEQGLMRLEGKEYIMQEGDVVLIRFNV
ncbi:MAG: redox-regulated ATPase YchF [Defluviitaleaceae bacterium]|nr:redox-regulated ATPase YchF [Defluviitaleaceae bacterium]